MASKKPVSERSLGPTLEFMRSLWALSHALETRSKAMQRALGVTGPQRLALRILGRCPDVTPSELAELLSLHRSTVTGIVSRLEARGLVTRAPNDHDGRRVHLRLTDAGSRANVARSGTVEHVVRDVLGSYDDGDVATIRRFLSDLASALEP